MQVNNRVKLHLFFLIFILLSFKFVSRVFDIGFLSFWILKLLDWVIIFKFLRYNFFNFCFFIFNLDKLLFAELLNEFKFVFAFAKICFLMLMFSFSFFSFILVLFLVKLICFFDYSFYFLYCFFLARLKD